MQGGKWATKMFIVVLLMMRKTEGHLRGIVKYIPLKEYYVAIFVEVRQNFIVTWKLTDCNIKRKGENSYERA